MLPLNVWATQKEHLSKMIVILSASFLKTLLENVAFDFISQHILIIWSAYILI